MRTNSTFAAMNNRQGNNNQQGQGGNRRNEAAQGRMRFFTTTSNSGTGNNNATMFFENVSSPVIVGPRDNREASIMLPPINNNNAVAEIIHISDEEEPDIESSLLEVNLNSSSSTLPTTEQTNQLASDLLTLQRNLGINTANNNNNQQDGMSLDLSLHQFGGDGSGSSSTIDITGGGAAGGGGGGGDGLLMSVLNNTSTRRIMPIKRTAPDYAHRDFTVGESSSAGGAAGHGGSVAHPMAAPKRRPTANENGVVRISSSSSNTCSCTPSPTCHLHGSTNNNPSSSSREQRHETANNNNNHHNNVVRVPSSLWPISEVQRALQSDNFQVLQPTATPPPPPPPPNNNNNNATLGIMQLDDGSLIYPQPVFDSSHHHHHRQLRHGHQRASINSFYHQGYQPFFSTADTAPFRPASMNYMENRPPPHLPYAGSSSYSSSPSSPSPLPWTTVIRPRAIPVSLPQRVAGTNRESNNTRNNYPFSSPSGRGTITVTHNRGNSSSSSLFPGGSPSTQLLQSLVQNAGIPSSGSGAAQNNTGTSVGAVPAFQQLSNVARAWIRRLNAHDETLTRMSQSSTTTTDNTPHRALRASAIAEVYNLPTYFADDSRRLRQEIRTAIDHLRNGGSVRLEELLILDYSIVLNLLDSIEEEEDADLPQQYYEYLGDGQRVTNPDLGLTETEVAACIGREVFQTVGEQPQNTDACGICQEDYVHGEELGRLDCAHRYHLSCIRQWLLIKNRCPVCKKMALTIIDLDDDDDDDE